MQISDKGLELIKQFEGYSGKAYYDRVGVITIGYGTTNYDFSITGVKIKKGTTCTKEQATKWLEKSVNTKYSPKVMKYNDKYNFNQNEFDALCSFAYNIGSIDSLTNYGKRGKREVADKMLSYSKAGGKYVQGLYNRRVKERELFLRPLTASTIVSSCPYIEPSKNITSVTQAKLRGCKNYISQGQSVRWLQWHLNKLGYDLGSYGIDGNCGSLTVNALLEFQQSVHITEDGICGAVTREKLKKAIN